MKEMIPPVDKRLIRAELTKDKFIRNTNFDDNEIYIFTSHECPNTMQEIGRLREIAYRDSGGGSGKAADIDDFDTKSNPYRQIIVWNPLEEEIVGGYRFFKMKEAEKTDDNKFYLATTNMFHLTDIFVNEYLPYTMELGKSFIQPQYQPSTNERKGMFSLDNLWDGLGALMVDNKDIKYFYGRVTLYLNYDEVARDILLYFLYKYFGDKDNLVYPYEPKEINADTEKLDEMFTEEGFEENFARLNQAVRDRNENIPPLIKAYMSLSPTMKTFGVAHNYSFGGNVEGIAIMIRIEDMYPDKIKRHVDTYIEKKKE